MGTIALELVPTSAEGGRARAAEEGRRTRELLQGAGLAEKVNTLMIPQIIGEEGDRPVPLEAKQDPLDFRRAVAEDLPLETIVTQVSVFTPVPELEKRVERIKAEGVSRVLFVGVPRIWNEEDVVGLYPSQALEHFRDVLPSRGVILISTRPDEEGRFEQKLRAGATFGMTQLLFSDHVVGFLRRFAERSERRPELLLSFGYVPKLETRKGLIRWLIQDESPVVKREMERVAEIAELPFKRKKATLVEHYRRVVEGAAELGFPVGVHLECPYGVSKPAFETFAAMLDAWSPPAG